MDPYINPFAPGAGSRPPELAGRDAVLSEARVACRRAVSGRHTRSKMLLGLRGTGKTVLLNEIRKIGEDENLLVTKIEAPEKASLARLLTPEMRKVMHSLSVTEAAKDLANRGLRGLQNFASIFKVKYADLEVGVEPEPGLADSGDLAFDLPDLFETIGQAAQVAGRGWLLLIDEIQYLTREDLSALIISLHHVSQTGLPVVFVGAGLPQVARLAGDAKSYAERLFDYSPIGALDKKSAARAIQRPVEEENASITADALAEVVKTTRGYPFFLQEWASKVWDRAQGPEIALAEVRQTYSETIASLDEGFFKVRFDRMTKTEIQFVDTMSELGDGPYFMADVATAMKRKISSLGPVRASLIKKGMVYSTDHGFLDFTVPLFADFLRRQCPAT